MFNYGAVKQTILIVAIALFAFLFTLFPTAVTGFETLPENNEVADNLNEEDEKLQDNEAEMGTDRLNETEDIIGNQNEFSEPGNPGQLEDSTTKHAVIFGERPPIDLAKVPYDAMEEGKIYLKLKPQAGLILEKSGLNYSKAGIAITGIERLDLLNSQFGATLLKALFNGLDGTKGKSAQYKDRHRAWGLHLWHEITVDKGHDLKSVIDAYNSLDEVETAEPIYKKQLHWTPNDPQFTNQWHYHNTGQQGGTSGADIDLVRAWDIEKGDPTVIVAIIDDGIQYNHLDIAANMWEDRGWNFVKDSATINPGNHGTHVAGTVAAVSNNSIGVAGIAGGSGAGDGVRLMSCQVFDGSYYGGFHLAPVYAADNGAAISQNSWSYTSPGVYEQVVLEAIDYFNVNGGGSVLDGGITIFAAGNDNSSANYYPGFYSGTMAVAATNNLDQKAYYSNYGTWVEISAPGGETNPLAARGVLSTITGNNYAYYQGTSMACPHVSGVAALIVSKAQGQLTASSVREILKESADDHYAVNHSYLGQLGTGRLNAYNALNETIGGVRNPGSFQADAISTSQINLSWNKNASNNSVMLVWSADGLFGTPINGNVYSAGQSIPGGGIVLYKGGNTAYSHMGLNESTKYFYRAFSYDASNHYSTGTSTSTTTLMVPISSYPWTETFENDSPTRAGWTQVQVSGLNLWTYATGSSGGSITSAYQGTLNARFTSSNTGGTTKLITPLLNLSSVSNPTLSFWYGQEKWQSDQNELKVYYRTDPSAAWVQIFHDNKNYSSWTSQSLALPNPGTAYQIAFEGIDNWGYANVLDNVTVQGDLTTGSIQVTIEPSTARAAGAQWRLTSGPDTGWKDSGVTIANLPPGSYTMTFKDISGWTKPADISVDIAAGSVVTRTGTYEEAIKTGSLQVTIEPSTARAAGAQWRLTSGPDTGWKDSGVTIANLPVGPYLITYKDISDTSNWIKPSETSVSVIEGKVATSTGTYAGQSFSDVPPSNVFYFYIEAIYAAEIAKGYTDGTYRPSEPVTREQMAAFLVRALKLDITNPPTEPSFPDVSTDNKFFDDIEAIYAAGIAKGYTDGTYRPSEPVSRGQMAAFLARGFDLLDGFVPPDMPTFPDVLTDNKFFDDIEAIYAAGIAKGYTDGTYRPNDFVAREQMAAFLSRALGLHQ